MLLKGSAALSRAVPCDAVLMFALSVNLSSRQRLLEMCNSLSWWLSKSFYKSAIIPFLLCSLSQARRVMARIGQWRFKYRVLGFFAMQYTAIMLLREQRVIVSDIL